MEIRVVALERKDPDTDIIYGSSGLMLADKYVITTANIFTTHSDFDVNSYTKFTNPLHLPSCLKHLTDDLHIIHKNSDDQYDLKSGTLLQVFVSEKLKSSTKQALNGWTVDTLDNAKDLATILSIFFVINVQSSGDVADFKRHLSQWWDLIRNEEVSRADEIAIKSAAFGNRFFLDSYSRGIVSNSLGQDSCLIVGDCSVTPGSEGSPVYKINGNCPFGIVISSSCWWRGDWTGLILIADLRPILSELILCDHEKKIVKSPNEHPLLDAVDKCLMQVYCRSQWGTGVVLDVDKGVLLTNSHVIDTKNPIDVYWNGRKTRAKIIYKTPDSEHFDLAILQCDLIPLKAIGLKSVIYLKSSAHSIGDAVYAAGFSLFSKNVPAKPSISKGFVAQSSESMITTTCCVNSGMSGGPVLNRLGHVVGIIVCNSRCEEFVYPRFNMAIPFRVIAPIIYGYLESGESSVLENLHINSSPMLHPWKKITAKL